MLIATESNVIASAGLQQTSNFRIATSAHAFRILSSGLYSDKIGAVLREIGCNAMDAHIAAGTPNLMFEVHLPSRIYPKFYVKDFGPGLSPDEVLSLYTTYFSSSKSQSNDFTGAFGLGSKSPFSYTDNFSIVSAHKGVKTTYAAYLDQTGAPAVSKVAEGPTESSWQHGMMISMAVKPIDFPEFANKAREIFQYFRVIPAITNGSPISRVEYSTECAEFAIPKQSGRGAYVVMGNVRYPIPEAELGSTAAWLQKMCPELRMNIGDVDVAASREQLEFTPKTRKSIDDRLKYVAAHVGKQYVDKVAHLQFDTWSNIVTSRAWLRNHLGNTQEWIERLLISGGMDAQKAGLIKRMMGYYYRLDCPHDFDGELSVLSCSYSRKKITYDVCKFEKLKTTTPPAWAPLRRELPFEPIDKVAILLYGDGKTKYPTDRLRHALQKTYSCLVKVSEDDATTLAVADMLYKMPTVKLADLPLPADWVRPKDRPRNPRPAKAVRTADCATFSNGTWTLTTAQSIEDLDSNQRYWVHRTCGWGKFTYHFGRYGESDLERMLHYLAQLAEVLPSAPRGVILTTENYVQKHKLETNYDCKSFKVWASRMWGTSSSLRQQVSRVYGERPPAASANGVCYEFSSPLTFLAAQALASSKLWFALNRILPNHQLLTSAAHLASGAALITATQPIPLALFNELARRLGEDKVSADKAIDESVANYPALGSMLSDNFGNRLVQTDVELAARVIAELIRHNDPIPTTIKLVA